MPVKSTIWRRKQRKKGLCLDCTAPVVLGFARCAEHLIKNNYYDRSSYQNVRESKIEKVKKRQRKLIAAGCCRTCGAPIDEDTTCNICYRIKRGLMESTRGTKHGITYHIQPAR